MRIHGKDVDAYLNGEKIEIFVQDDLRSLHDISCSVTYAKYSDLVKWRMMFRPITKAEETINWFLYGKKYGSPPKHFNCRCEHIILESKESFKK